MKSFKSVTVFAFFAVAIFSTCTTQKVKKIVVSDYGIKANTKLSVTAQVNKLIEGLDNEPVEILFPKGRYDFFPDSNYFKPYFETNTYDINPKRLAVFLKNKNNITIDAQGSDFTYHGHIQPFTLDNSENITIKNVNIDWEFPLTAESEVIEYDKTHVIPAHTGDHGCAMVYNCLYHSNIRHSLG